MTEEDFQIIERVAKIHGFTVHPAEPEYDLKRRITDKADINRCNFYWKEDDGFNSFFDEVYSFGFSNGYDSASRNY
jgi:hypothetical protein